MPQLSNSQPVIERIAAQYADQGVGLASINQPEYDQLAGHQHAAFIRLDVVYDGALDEDLQLVVAPADGGIIETLAEAVAEQVRGDYTENPDSTLGWSVEIYEVDHRGDSLPEGGTPLVSHSEPASV